MIEQADSSSSWKMGSLNFIVLFPVFLYSYLKFSKIKCKKFFKKHLSITFRDTYRIIYGESGTLLGL